MSQGGHHLIAFDEYVRMEAMSPLRLDGAVWAVARGTPEHAAIAVNITTQLRGKRCLVFSADLRLRERATGLGTSPDASVICGAVQFDPDDMRKTTAVNPKVVVEVLSHRRKTPIAARSSSTTSEFRRSRRSFSWPATNVEVAPR